MNFTDQLNLLLQDLLNALFSFLEGIFALISQLFGGFHLS